MGLVTESALNARPCFEYARLLTQDWGQIGLLPKLAWGLDPNRELSLLLDVLFTLFLAHALPDLQRPKLVRLGLGVGPWGFVPLFYTRRSHYLKTY